MITAVKRFVSKARSFDALEIDRDNLLRAINGKDEHIRHLSESVRNNDSKIADLIESVRIMALSVPERAAAMSGNQLVELQGDNEALRMTLVRQAGWIEDRDALINQLRSEIAKLRREKPATKETRRKAQ